MAEPIGRSATVHAPCLDPMPQGQWEGFSLGGQGR